ncbi:hypothetical protein [Caulobacter vibrioides]|uniref:Uncharacterized protein n=1 Tax=Caulobacter vibrioides (strain NA1000 / CB15N) TaxID=565050 RepID=A0A0H3C499_CAUVN|nr:hypothetical protein [Caulobacter vibrioides]YP_002515693.2 hypothetical protein CCNA_00318 [Caulobacter vibrioides NA1000]ACL93785.2 hypothetical protein CCNA_00318 [Caulobacter vibrioides NA1000]QXZ52409.1 hypothetical protein KZH45_01625 [Caulobacter vibrioides]
MASEEEVVALLAKDLRDLSTQELHRKYSAEASTHRNILIGRGTGVAPQWRDFKTFLGEVGPRPSTDHSLVLLNRYERTYGPGRARWMTAEEQAAHEAEFDRLRAEQMREEQLLLHKAAATRRASTPGAPSFGQWTPMGGKLVTYPDVAKKLAIPVNALSKTMPPGSTADELVKRAATAADLINENATWLPPDPVRKAGFFEAYRIWHLQVQPQFGRAATPTFLFLYIALPVMKQCRDELMDLDLWNPLGQRALNARDNHPAWKKYTEFMPRAQVAMMEIPIYATYSLLSDLDALCERIVTAEKRFREGPQKVIHTHRAA